MEEKREARPRVLGEKRTSLVVAAIVKDFFVKFYLWPHMGQGAEPCWS
jgi:hypothetical protein